MNFNKIRQFSDAPIFRGYKVLIATITSDAKAYCQDDFLENMALINYKPSKFLILDNSETKHNAKAIQKRFPEAEVLWFHRKGRTAKQMMYLCENFLRDYFLKNNFHFLLRLESDLFPPQDIVQKLMMHQLPCVGATYFIGQGWKSHLMLQDIEEKQSNIQELCMANVDKGNDMQRLTGGLIESASCGHGCMLTAREVEEKIQLVYDERLHPDSQWHYQRKQHQIKCFIDSSLILEHRNQLWND